MTDAEILVFPEPKEISCKEGRVILDDSYRVVVCDDTPMLEMEAAKEIVEKVKSLTKQRLDIVKQHQLTEEERLILIGTCFQHRLAVKLDRSDPEGYILEIDEGMIFICGNGPAGTFCAGQTFKQLLKLEGNRVTLPKVTIKDWPDYRYRGLYVESKWGPDLMTLDDWKEVIDFLASIKLNLLGVGIYGCWVVQYEERITEFLLLPMRSYPKLKTPKTIRYYSPDRKEWTSLTYTPTMVTEDFFSELIAYGKRRNVIVRPAFNSLGHNTLIPRKYPEISSINGEGRPTQYGFCLSNPKTCEIMFNIYDEIIEKYLEPNGIDLFHIQLDEVYKGRGKDPKDPKKVVDPWCRCLQCSRSSREDLFLNYIVKLIRHLHEKGINKVGVWNDQITRMNGLEKFASLLKEENLEDNVAMEWWMYGIDEKRLDTSSFDFGKFGSELGMPRWVTPMAGYYIWQKYDSRIHNIYIMLKRGFQQGAEGTEAYCIYDHSLHRNYYCLADYSWNQTKERDLNAFQERYAKALFRTEWRKGLKALGELDKIVSPAGNPNDRFLGSLFYYPYSYVHPDLDYPRSYPQEALQSLKRNLPNSLNRIKEFHETIAASRQLFSSIKKVRTASPRLIDQYIVECERLQSVLKDYLLILEALENYQEAKKKYAEARDISLKFLDQATATINEALGQHESAMMDLENIKALYYVPSILRDLSFMIEFLISLRYEISNIREDAAKGEVSKLPALSIE